MLHEKLKKLSESALSRLEQADSVENLLQLKTELLGKSGELTLILKDLGKLDPEARKEAGLYANQVRDQITKAFESVMLEQEDRKLALELKKTRIDVTAPGLQETPHGFHPVTLVLNELTQILGNLGFSVRTGPMIESDRYNFEALNMPKDHPARDMQDTFYIQDQVLRTHTSPIQIRVLETEKPPLRICGVGSVFRKDSDISHLPHFHQLEGMAIDRKVSMAELKGTITYLVSRFFSKDLRVRFRPSFFPFTEPSAEVDCQCPLCEGKGCAMCKDSGWVEIGGCGLMHPKVFQAVKMPYPEWRGFAFGFGIERMAIIKYGIRDIRLFPQNDFKFLESFAGIGISRPTGELC